MSEYEYKVGDRVRIVKDDEDPELNGKCGVILSIEAARISEGIYPFEVLLDEAEYPGDFGPHEIELTKATPAEPDLVRSPPHYSLGTPDGIEVIDIIRAHMKAGGTWETANALKYILRFPFKGNATQDVAKAVEYLTMWTNEQVSA